MAVRQACLGGVGATRYAKRGGITEASEHQLACEAIRAVVAHAALAAQAGHAEVVVVHRSLCQGQLYRFGRGGAATAHGSERWRRATNPGEGGAGVPTSALLLAHS